MFSITECGYHYRKKPAANNPEATTINRVSFTRSEGINEVPQRIQYKNYSCEKRCEIDFN
jgi:hypothetical protein